MRTELRCTRPSSSYNAKVAALQIATTDPATAAIVLREWLTSAPGAAVVQGAANEG